MVGNLGLVYLWDIIIIIIIIIIIVIIIIGSSSFLHSFHGRLGYFPFSNKLKTSF